MSRKLMITAAALLCTLALSAQPAQRPKPLVSPEINGDQVTFRIRAPKAYDVRLHGSWMDTDSNCYGDYVLDESTTGTIPMARTADGEWYCTIDTPSPELYTYNFYVDGVYVSDAANPLIQRDGMKLLSVLLVPGELSENYFEAKQHGDITMAWYNSKILGGDRRMYIYTPYGYAENKKAKYPVLYLLHGGGCDEDTWNSMGRACQIVDNLIEKGQAKPMLVVMPNGNSRQAASPFLQVPELKAGQPASRDFATDFCASLVKEIIPYVESHYRVIAKPEGRAVSGLSMGGFQTLTVTANYPGTFAYIVPMGCGGQRNEEFVNGLLGIKKAGYKLYWHAAGTADFTHQGATVLDSLLTENGMPHTFYEKDGGHTWSNWRIFLNKSLPLLFR